MGYLDIVHRNTRMYIYILTLKQWRLAVNFNYRHVFSNSHREVWKIVSKNRFLYQSSKSAHAVCHILTYIITTDKHITLFQTTPPTGKNSAKFARSLVTYTVRLSSI